MSSVFRFGPGSFRFFLALVVFISHTTRVALGVGAVFLFFALSGYWIAQMWKEKYSSRYGIYITSRIWRLAAVFIVCSLFAWIIVARSMPREMNWAHEIFSSIFILGYGSMAFIPNGPAWSLDVEMQFYLIAPLLIAAMSRPLPTLCAAVAISIFGVWIGWTASLMPYLIFFAIGIAFARASFPLANKVAAASSLVGIAVFVGTLMSPWRGAILIGAHTNSMSDYNPLANSILAYSLLPFALWTAQRVDTSFDRFLGDMSFTVYLTHWPILQLIDTSKGGFQHRAIMTMAALVATLTLSAVLWWAIDRPSNRLRNRWVRGRLHKQITGYIADG